MRVLPKPMQRVGAGLATLLVTCVCLGTARADDAHQHGDPAAQAEPGKAKHSSKGKAKKADASKSPPSAAAPADAAKAPAAPAPVPAPAPEAAEVDPVCKLGEAEQPRGGRLDVLGDRFGSAPVVRIAGKPARILIRKQDRISVQVPADSDGGEITLLNDGKVASCGTLVIIGKNR
jgi:hypothetical protein